MKEKASQTGKYQVCEAFFEYGKKQMGRIKA